MDNQSFHRTHELLLMQGITVEGIEYGASSFGSWHITVAALPRMRIVWDGKDRWLYVQQETNEFFAGSMVWADMWIARHAAEQTAEHAVAQILGLLNNLR